MAISEDVHTAGVTNGVPSVCLDYALVMVHCDWMALGGEPPGSHAPFGAVCQDAQSSPGSTAGTPMARRDCSHRARPSDERTPVLDR